MGLIMAFEVRSPPAHVVPFRKSFSPPSVVLGAAVELGQVKGDGVDVAGDGSSGDVRFTRYLKCRLVNGERALVCARDTSLSASIQDKMSQRLQVLPCYIRVGVNVVIRIEGMAGFIPAPPPHCEVVSKQVDALQNFAAILRIVMRIKQRLRRKACFGSHCEVVEQWVSARGFAIRGLFYVPFGVEKRMRFPTFARTQVEVVLQGTNVC